MLRRLSVDASCYDKVSCESVWDDDEILEDVFFVGRAVPPGTVPLAEGEVALRIRRQVVIDAGIR